MSNIPLDFLGMLGLLLLVALAIGIYVVVRKRRRLKHLENPRRDFFK